MKNNGTSFRLKYGPYALIAGGSLGLGRAYAEALAKLGLNLALLARRREHLENTANYLREKYPVEVLWSAVDLADYEQTKRFVNGLSVAPGLLVYNAANAPIGLFKEIPEEQLAYTAAVNVRAPLLLTGLLAPKMIEKGRGGIVLMSSLAGVQGSPKLAAYAATKAFNCILAEGLWKELKPYGIDVIACCAGAILTPGYEQAEHSKAAPGTLTPQEVAEQTLNALGKGPIVIPGAVNKIARFFMARVLSRKAAINLMSNNTGGLS
ncbi:MAG: SDR family NAD(P)-dependent oxidoreductase [Treponema sp.]|jgi:short-subunit dehydrogenase|nr:SDR family NAD(P)-dependent oxidoreductase [Treponema sp.]